MSSVTKQIDTIDLTKGIAEAMGDFAGDFNYERVCDAVRDRVRAQLPEGVFIHGDQVLVSIDPETHAPLCGLSPDEIREFVRDARDDVTLTPILERHELNPQGKMRSADSALDDAIAAGDPQRIASARKHLADTARQAIAEAQEEVAGAEVHCREDLAEWGTTLGWDDVLSSADRDLEAASKALRRAEEGTPAPRVSRLSALLDAPLPVPAEKEGLSHHL